MGCPYLLHWLCSAAGGVASDVANNVLSVIANAIETAEKWVIGNTLGLWVKLPVGTPDTAGAQFLRDNTAWIVGAVGVIGLLVAAIRLALQRRSEPAKLAARGLVNMAVTSAGSIAFITLGAQAGDAYSNWIVSQGLAVHGGGQSALAEAQAALMLSAPQTAALPILLIIMFGLIGILASIAQIFLLVIRSAVLGLLAGLMPLAAAASNTEAGRAWFAKFCGWMLAYLLYKPVAATILAYAFVPLSSPSLEQQVEGMAMLALTVIALPALMRLVTPLVASVTPSGNSGTGAAFAAVGIALGARALRQSGGAGPLPGGDGPGSGPDGAGRVGGAAGGGPGGSGGGAARTIQPDGFEWTDGRDSQHQGGRAPESSGPALGPGVAPAGAGGAGVGAAARAGGGMIAGGSAAAGGAAAGGAAAGGAATSGAAAAGPAAPVVAAALVANQVRRAASSAATEQVEGGPSGSR